MFTFDFTYDFFDTAEGKQNFLEGSTAAWGWPEFMPLNELHDPYKGYIVDDTCIITVEVTCWSKEEDSDDDDDEDAASSLGDNLTANQSSDPQPQGATQGKRTEIKEERQ